MNTVLSDADPSWRDHEFGQPTPSLDDKDVASPPIVTTEMYERDKQLGFNRIGRPLYGSRSGLSVEG